jgi:hypothetical protein
MICRLSDARRSTGQGIYPSRSGAAGLDPMTASMPAERIVQAQGKLIELADVGFGDKLPKGRRESAAHAILCIIQAALWKETDRNDPDG